jgi:hypothetical protein
MFKFFRNDFTDNLHSICRSLKEGKTYQMFSTIEFNFKFDGTKLTIDGPTHTYYKIDPYVIVHDAASGKISFNDKYLDNSTYKFFYKAIRDLRENLEKRQADEELIRQKKKEFHEKFPLEVLNNPNRYATDITPKSGSRSSADSTKRRSGDVNTDIFWSSVSDSGSDSDSRSSGSGRNSDD